MEPHVGGVTTGSALPEVYCLAKKTLIPWDETPPAYHDGKPLKNLLGALSEDGSQCALVWSSGAEWILRVFEFPKGEAIRLYRGSGTLQALIFSAESLFAAVKHPSKSVSFVSLKCDGSQEEEASFPGEFSLQGFTSALGSWSALLYRKGSGQYYLAQEDSLSCLSSQVQALLMGYDGFASSKEEDCFYIALTRGNPKGTTEVFALTSDADSIQPAFRLLGSSALIDIHTRSRKPGSP